MKKLKMGFVFLILFLLLLYPVRQAFMQEKHITYEKYYVSQGDTIYDIARSYPHRNLNEFIYEIRKINGLDNCIITPGQEILIPLER